MKYLIDANVFLQAALGQDSEESCRKFLDRVSSGDIEAATTLFHMDASAVVMENRSMEREDIGSFYFEAYSSEGLEIVNTGVSARLNALSDNTRSGLDDGLLSAAFKELDVDKIVTYDTDFEEENRITPEEIIQDTT
jgi:predicted nucleic acid-binding protein